MCHMKKKVQTKYNRKGYESESNCAHYSRLHEIDTAGDKIQESHSPFPILSQEL